MIPSEARDEALPLEARIHAVERRLLERRRRIGSTAASLGSRARARMSSPGGLAAAVGFGVFLHRSRDRRAQSLMTLSRVVYASSSLARTLWPWLSADPGSRSVPSGASGPLLNRR
jgi:hypothetical protein